MIYKFTKKSKDFRIDHSSVRDRMSKKYTIWVKTYRVQERTRTVTKKVFKCYFNNNLFPYYVLLRFSPSLFILFI